MNAAFIQNYNGQSNVSLTWHDANIWLHVKYIIDSFWGIIAFYNYIILFTASNYMLTCGATNTCICTLSQKYTRPCYCAVQHSWRAETPWQLLWQKTLRRCVHVCIKVEELELKDEVFGCEKTAFITQTTRPFRCTWATDRLCFFAVHMSLIPYHINVRKHTWPKGCHWINTKKSKAQK